MNIKDVLIGLGVDLSSKNDLKKKRLKKLSIQFKKRRDKIITKLKNENKKSVIKELEEELEIIKLLRSKNIKSLQKVINKMSK